jgi:uncharacterized membrane protein
VDKQQMEDMGKEVKMAILSSFTYIGGMFLLAFFTHPSAFRSLRGIITLTPVTTHV